MSKHQNQPEHNSEPDRPDDKPKSSNPNIALKYSGMAFQMGIIIWIGTFLGQKADAYFELETPYLAALGALLGLVAAFYIIFKDLLKGN